MAKFEELAEAACITCERFPGVDGDQLDLNDLFQSGHITAEIEASYAKHPKNKGNLGCMMSHIKMWINISSLDATGTFCVFEGDAKIPEDFEKTLHAVGATLPEDWRMAYIGHNEPVGTDVNKDWVKPQNLPAGNQSKGKNALLHCYLLRPAGAHQLLQFMRPINHRQCVDVVMRQNFDKFTAYILKRQIIRQMDLPSDRETRII